MSYPTINDLISRFEGYGTPNAPTITKANNPGAIKFGSFADANGAIGSFNGFAVFPDFQTGYAALDKLVAQKVDAGATPRTLIQGGGGILGWAPPSADGNSQSSADAYSRSIAKGTGAGLDTPLKNIFGGGVNGVDIFSGIFGGLTGTKGITDSAGLTPQSSDEATPWFFKLTLVRIVCIIVGFILIIFGVFFLRSVQSGIIEVQGHARKAAGAIEAISA